jgi:hypothetical protein
LILSRFVFQTPNISNTTDKYSAIPLNELDQSALEGLPHIVTDADATKDRRTLTWWLKIGVFSGIGCARIIVYRSIADNIECAPPGYTVSSATSSEFMHVNTQ